MQRQLLHAWTHRRVRGLTACGQQPSKRSHFPQGKGGRQCVSGAPARTNQEPLQTARYGASGSPAAPARAGPPGSCACGRASAAAPGVCAAPAGRQSTCCLWAALLHRLSTALLHCLSTALLHCLSTAFHFIACPQLSTAFSASSPVHSSPLAPEDHCQKKAWARRAQCVRTSFLQTTCCTCTQYSAASKGGRRSLPLQYTLQLPAWDCVWTSRSTLLHACTLAAPEQDTLTINSHHAPVAGGTLTHAGYSGLARPGTACPLRASILRST